ncbi:UDP-glucuronosyltransferase 2B17-like [Cricetulus griseus]|uniref:UDP-glucuronosyltransferase 2B17-like n=1 Tax=Cricetulus griseus TaxID=10029 RepID=UPI000F74BD96|nr:UDP-glucuronosyltransferase 2B17-like [Cricetulus griseus]
MNIKIILDELALRGHEVTVLRSSASIFLDPQKSPGLKFETSPKSINANYPCGELLYFPGYIIEKYSGRLLILPSYVPIILTGLSDQMTFLERLGYMMICLLYFGFCFQPFTEKKWDLFYTEI